MGKEGKMPVANTYASVFKKIVEGHKTIEKPIWIKEIGDFNTMPTPFKQIKDKKEFRNALFHIIYYDSVMEYRQVREVHPVKDWNNTVSIKIFWQWNCGYGICINPKTDELEIYKIGCEHKNTKETRLSMHHYKVKCSNCGFEYEYNCSD